MLAPSETIMLAPTRTGPIAGLAPQRILHVFRAPVGGLFRHVADLARLQAAAGHAVGLFCDSSTGGARAERTLAELAPHLALGVTRVPMRRNPHWRDLTAYRALALHDRRIGPTVLHGHGSKGGLYARTAWAGTAERRPIRAYTPHGGSFNYRPGTAIHRAYMMAERVLTRRTDVFLFESEYVAGRYARFVGETDRLVRIIPNGLAEAEFEPVAPSADAKDLVYVGELREAKGVGYLLRALASLRRPEGGTPSLLVVGSGPDEDLLKGQVRALGLGDVVTFVPPCPIRDALRRGRVMVVPSLAESLPYVVLEAAAAAHPLVSTNVGGIPEIFGSFGDRLVAPHDAAALASAITQTLAEPQERRRERAEALMRDVSRRFSMRCMAEGVLAGYAAALGEQQSVGPAAVPSFP